MGRDTYIKLMDAVMAKGYAELKAEFMANRDRTIKFASDGNINFAKSKLSQDYDIVSMTDSSGTTVAFYLAFHSDETGWTTDDPDILELDAVRELLAK